MLFYQIAAAAAATADGTAEIIGTTRNEGKTNESTQIDDASENPIKLNKTRCKVCRENNHISKDCPWEEELRLYFPKKQYNTLPMNIVAPQ